MRNRHIKTRTEKTQAEKKLNTIPKEKGNRRVRKCNTTETLHPRPFFLILWICGHGRTLFTTLMPPFLYFSQLSPVSILFHTDCQFAVLWQAQRCFLFSLSLSLRKSAVKRADYWMALKLLFCPLTTQSTSPSLIHFFFFFLHFLASLSLTYTLPLLFI